MTREEARKACRNCGHARHYHGPNGDGYCRSNIGACCSSCQMYVPAPEGTRAVGRMDQSPARRRHSLAVSDSRDVRDAERGL